MRKAGYSDKPLVVDMLTRSFNGNPSVNYIVKQDSKRGLRIKKLMEYSFEICFAFGSIFLSDNQKACALLLFPDQKKISLKTIGLDIKLALGVIGLKRITKVMDREARIHKGYPKENICYLWFICVDPQYQRKGMGSRFLKEILVISAEKNRPVYLETSLPENVSFYHKHGFEVYNQLEFDYTLYCMRRKP